MLFILRADGTGKGAGSSGAAKRKANKNLKPLWDPKKLQVGDNFSNISYMKIDKIDGDTITVTNTYGGSWIMSKALIVRDAWSADHYEKEVKTTMTSLAEILTLCKDTVFTVSFKKKVDVKDVEETLKKTNFKDDKAVKQMQKQIVEGQECVITGYLTGNESTLGRSIVVDLNAPATNNIRQVDHRTINWIVF